MIKKYFFYLLFFQIAVLCPIFTAAQDTLVYTSDQPLLDIGRFSRHHLAPDGTLSMEQLGALPDAAFEKSKGLMNFGNSTATIGIKLLVKNESGEPLFLSFENNETQHIDLLTIDENGQRNLQYGGSFDSISNRELKRGNAVLGIGEKPSVVYIRIRSHASLYLPTSISTMPKLVDMSYKRDVFKGITLGVMLAMFLYNLFIFFIVRDRLYLYYCLYVLAGIWTYSHLNGLWYFVWTDFPFLNRYLGIQVFSLSAAIFTFKFLKSKEVTPRLYKVMLVMFTMIALTAPLEYFDIQPFTNNFLQLFIVVGICVLFSAGVLAYRAGNVSAKYFVIAWILFLMGSIITLLSFLGWVPFNFWTFNASAIGACIENLLLSFALANRINIYRAESEQAQALAFQRLEENERLVREKNIELEEKVHERTKELENSLETLQATQTQLIHSEKLASLGELTAGIAHEIQNPLNFVNNFSDLSVDLAKDLNEEIQRPDQDKAYIDELLSDLLTNQEKINHHGKRAASIVKGMLDHSRTTTSEKLPTDINKLADEYLRLSYHGLRAKDKSFNADFQTIFEEDLPKLNLISQDIGRVFLNMFNNAFYAVAQRKSKTNDPEYTPTVSVTTKKLGTGVEIRVRDNGTGMPESVKEKVFQPFFTTKPTGSGTGLGLSISYDIITKGHNGTFEIETKEGEFTEFIIKLP